MKRFFRLLAFFVLGLMLGGFTAFAFAETLAASVPIPATEVMVNPNTGVAYATLQELCDFYTSQGGAAYPFVATPPKSCVRTDNFGNKTTYSASTKWMCGSVAAGYNATTGTYICGMGCESGQNWTLTGTTCTRPDCSATETRNASTGICEESNTCKLAANAQAGATRYAFPYPQPSGKTYCAENCQVYPGPEGNIVGKVRYAYAYVNGAGMSASNCSKTQGDEPSAPVADPKKTAATPCAATDGVMSYGGKVVCVPSDTAGATVPPVVTKKTSTDTKSDGSQIITTTTQTCTGDGACAVNTTTTVTTNSSGVAGLAGTPGTSTGTSNTSATTGNGEGTNQGATVAPGVVEALPKLYTPKYENGLKGVWDTESAKIKASPLFALTAVFTPNVASGTCPAWSFSTNIGPSMNFGSNSMAPPCWVWSALRTIFLITALLTARRLIFGG